MSDLGKHSPSVYDNDGVTYIFGYYKQVTGWTFVPYRFQLINLDRNKVTGQFLTSNWFTCDYRENETAHFMILGLNKSFSYSEIKKYMNNCLPSQLIYHKLNDEEKEMGICFKDYYMINKDKVNYYSKNIKKNSKEIYLMGYNGLSQLTLCVRSIKNDVLYVTLPDFTMEINNFKNINLPCDYKK